MKKAIILVLTAAFSLNLVEMPFHLVKSTTDMKAMEGWHCGLKLCERRSHENHDHHMPAASQPYRSNVNQNTQGKLLIEASPNARSPFSSSFQMKVKDHYLTGDQPVKAKLDKFLHYSNSALIILPILDQRLDRPPRPASPF